MNTLQQLTPALPYVVGAAVLVVLAMLVNEALRMNVTCGIIQVNMARLVEPGIFFFAQPVKENISN